MRNLVKRELCVDLKTFKNGEKKMNGLKISYLVYKGNFVSNKPVDIDISILKNKLSEYIYIVSNCMNEKFIQNNLRKIKMMLKELKTFPDKDLLSMFINHINPKPKVCIEYIYIYLKVIESIQENSSINYDFNETLLRIYFEYDYHSEFVFHLINDFKVIDVLFGKDQNYYKKMERYYKKFDKGFFYPSKFLEMEEKEKEEVS